jgi:hypothetical protein
VVPGEYVVAADRVIAHGGRSSGRLSSIVAKPTRYGLIGQLIDAAPYHGKRLRLSAYVRTESAGWGGLFMRVDAPDLDPKHALAIDAMERRPIRGTKDWTRVEVVLDVAPEASQIAFGASLTGAGVVWIDDVRIEVVDHSVPTTNYHPPDRPQNPDFEE